MVWKDPERDSGKKATWRNRIQDSATQPSTCVRKKKRRRRSLCKAAGTVLLAPAESRQVIKTSNPVRLDRARAFHEVEDRLQLGRLYLRLVLMSQQGRILRRGRRGSLTKLASWRCLGLCASPPLALSVSSLGLPMFFFATVDHRTVSSKLRQTHCHHRKLYEPIRWHSNDPPRENNFS